MRVEKKEKKYTGSWQATREEDNEMHDEAAAAQRVCELLSRRLFIRRWFFKNC